MIKIKYSYIRGLHLNLLFSLVGALYITLTATSVKIGFIYYLKVFFLIFIDFSPIMILLIFLANCFIRNVSFSSEGILSDKKKELIKWDDISIAQDENVTLLWRRLFYYSFYIESKNNSSVGTLFHISYLNEKSALEISQKLVPENNIIFKYIDNYKAKRKIKS